MGEIKVKVVSYGKHRPLSMVYRDPNSGKRVAKSAGTYDEVEAERAAAVWQEELLSGRYVQASRVTWDMFVSRYEDGKLSAMRNERSADQSRISLRLVKRTIGIDRLAKMTTPVVAEFIAKLRRAKMRESTIAHHLRAIKAALNWAVKHGLLAKAPEFEMPRAGKAKSRPITLEEFERMLEAVPKVQPNDAADWVRYLRFLWLSGLRLEESLILSWDDGAPFAIDGSGKHPVFRIEADAQKGGRDEVVPIMPDCWQLLSETPAGQRVGRVFPFQGGLQRVSRIVGSIGRKAGVVVGRTRKWVLGKPDANERRQRVEKEVTQFAGCHSLRRSFGTRWARQVMPAVLKKLMRHANIQTTMTFYVDLDAEELGADLWQRFGEPKSADNTSGNSRPASEAAGHSEQLHK